ncbi:MAG: hypothetical protein CME70_16850 [Halobacteriovorax sp.]|nr:hypothetical protein [Halobacteriovorax sp.]|tara:strand:- start:158663 stop:159247 length:585 start_codon:yes stop_codon:yes gene_type:complete
MKTLIILIGLFFSLASNAKITATVEKFNGQVLYNGKQISNATIFEENGFIEVKEKSYLKLKVAVYNSTMALGPGAKLQIKFPPNPKHSPFTLFNGLLRWATKGPAKQKGLIKTKTAAMAVRGTEFLAVVSELLGETEIYCFNGKVIFANRANNKDRKEVSVNDWGGIGGRFGEDVGDIVPMTEKQIDHVKGLLE